MGVVAPVELYHVLGNPQLLGEVLGRASEQGVEGGEDEPVHAGKNAHRRVLRPQTPHLVVLHRSLHYSLSPLIQLLLFLLKDVLELVRPGEEVRNGLPSEQHSLLLGLRIQLFPLHSQRVLHVVEGVSQKSAVGHHHKRPYLNTREQQEVVAFLVANGGVVAAED